MKKLQVSTQKRKAQGMVEFALVLPILLLLIFGIIEYSRLFYAWIIIENAARSGVRYAVTGNYNEDYCVDGPDQGGQKCDGEGRYDEIDLARIPSIRDEAQKILFGNIVDYNVTENDPNYLHTTICSGSDGHAFVKPQMGGTQYSECYNASGSPEEHPGASGERVIVSVDYNFPFIVPFFKEMHPYFHLASYREGIVEQFRVSRVVNIPATIVVPTVPTPPPTPTATPDCNQIRIESLAIAEDDLVASVSNNIEEDMPLTDSQLIWENVGGRNQKVNFFKWNNRTYYNGDDAHSPTNATCSGNNCAFPDGSTREWRANFNNVGTTLYGDFQLDLTFADVCTVSSALSLEEPDIDCNLLKVKKVWFQGDDFRVKVRNNNPMDVPLTNASLTWPQQPSNAVINWFKWNWQNPAFYNGDTGASPYSAACSGEGCAFPPLTNRVWVVDFNHIPNNTLTGSHEVTLTFADKCDIVASLGPNCNDIEVNNMRIGSLNPDNGNSDNLFVDVTNNNKIPIRLTYTSFSWTNMFGNGVDWIELGGSNYYDGNSYTSPTEFSSTFIVPANQSYLWNADYTNSNGPIYGDYDLDLTFDYGECTVSDTLTAFTPTPSPTPDCTNITAQNLRVGSMVYGNGETDNIKMEVTNNNPTSIFLTNTIFHWTNPFGRGVDWINFGGSRYYDGNSFSSPTVINGSRVELPAGQTYTWDADFTGWDKIPFSGEYSVELVFDERCPVSDSLFVASPTPSLTPTVTNTATNTPLPTPTNTPTPTADCNLISAGSLNIDHDDVNMTVTNNNPQPIRLTYTNFIWSSYYGNGVNYFRFGGSQYYNGNDYSSPTQRGATNIWLPSGATYTWVTDFTGYDIPMYGPFDLTLTFDGRCDVGNSVVGPASPTPSNTPIPTRTLIPSATPTASNTPTATATFRPTNTPTHTPEPSNTPPASPTPTYCFDC